MASRYQWLPSKAAAASDLCLNGTMNEKLKKLLNGRRKHLLLTAALKRKLPPLMGQDGKGDDAIVHVKLFCPYSDFTWYLTEYDPKDNQAFGVAYQALMVDQLPAGEFGYISIEELENMHRNGLPLIERDLYFTPTTVGEIRAKLRLKSAA